MNNIDFLKQQKVKNFIKTNIHMDVESLLLSPPKEWVNYINLLADQLISRKKASKKLPEWASNWDIIFPRPVSVEQASSLQTATYKSSLLQGKHLIDLTGGMGIDSLALSKNFDTLSYVEQNLELCEIFEHNLAILGNDADIINSTAEDFVKNLEKEEVTFFLDPARRDDKQQKIFKLEDCTPNILELLPQLKEKSIHILIKLSPLVDIKLLTMIITEIKEIHIISVKNDCREVLVLIQKGWVETPTIITVNLETDQTSFSFQVEDELKAKVTLGSLENFIFEPNASVLKSGAFQLVSQRYNLCKLGANTHLYSSKHPVKPFPGRVYKVLESDAKSNLKKYAANGNINVVTRNFTTHATALKKKLKLKDGGKYFLIGFKNLKAKPCLVIAERFL